MRRGFENSIFGAWTVLAILTILGMGIDILPALAKQQTTHAGPQAAVGGLTVAEEAARSSLLHKGLTNILPFGVENEKIAIEIDQKDRDDMTVTPPSGTAPLRVGIVKTVPGTVGKAAKQSFNFGVVQSNPDGSFVWAMVVKSPGAQAIRVHLTDFSLPDNTEMYFLSSNNQAHGPYTEKGRNNTGEFWTRSIASDTGTILLNYTGDSPYIDRPKMSFTISDVGHIRGRPPRSQEKNSDTWPCSDNVDCLVDVNCVNTGPAAPAENAVAKMEWIESSYIYTCSGGLLADTDPSTQIPYFLTANHCLSTSNSSLETFFNYTTTDCELYCPANQITDYPPPSASTVGVTVMATGENGDFTLLTLDEPPPADAVFLGWNNAPIASVDGSDLYRVSNPNFGPQVYSQHRVDAGSFTCPDWPSGERIYSQDLIGATMGGSSGSPVLNSNGEVVGQLSGSCGFNINDECDSLSNRTVDGALAFYWEHVADFLDPVQAECGNNSHCDDGLFCNGQETCNNGVCLNGTPECNDNGFFCDGSEYCDEEVDLCMSTGNPCDLGVVCDDANDKCFASSCGDGQCGEGENCDNCSSDCIGGTVGGDNETDCFKERADGVCHPRKDGPDCSDCAVIFCCGNGICEDGESSSNCEIDCGPTPFCGDGNCDSGEQCSCDDCPVDATETSCDDGLDNDCNGFTDLDDENCSSCGEKKSPCEVNSDCCSNRCSKRGVCL